MDGGRAVLRLDVRLVGLSILLPVGLLGGIFRPVLARIFESVLLLFSVRISVLLAPV